MIEPYSKNTVVELWNDPYISAQMLKYHLQTDNDIVSRNIKDIQDTVKFIVKRYKPSSICDLGCAVGLYTNLFEKQGITVTGIDISTKAIKYAKLQNHNVEYINANYIDYKFNRQYDMMTMIYFDFCALTDNGRVSVLDTVRNSLNDNGVFMFDVWSYKFYELIKEEQSKHKDVNGFYMKEKHTLKKETIKYDDKHLILNHINVNSKRKQMEFYNWDKCFNVEEITKLLNDNGFKVVDIYNNTYGEKYTKDSYGITVVCKRR